MRNLLPYFAFVCLLACTLFGCGKPEHVVVPDYRVNEDGSITDAAPSLTREELLQRVRNRQPKYQRSRPR